MQGDKRLLIGLKVKALKGLDKGANRTPRAHSGNCCCKGETPKSTEKVMASITAEALIPKPFKSDTLNP